GNFSTSYWSGGQGEFDPPTGTSTTYTLAPSESGNIELSFCIVGICGDTVCGTYQLEVIALSPPVITVDPTPVSCGASAPLSASVQGTNNFFWNGGTGVFSSPTSLNTNYSPGAAESGTIDLEFCAIGGCADTICTPFQLLVDGPPVIVITANGPTTFCEGTELILMATGGDSYIWSTGSSGATVTVNSEDTFNVTATNACGQSTESISTVVTPLPVASVTGPAATCPGTMITLIASGGSTYNWNTGAAGDTIVVEGPGTYTVTVSEQCGSDQATITVAQGTALAPAFTAAVTEGCSPLCVVFSTEPAPNTTFTWLFGDGSEAEGSSPEHCFEAGDHDVTLTTAEVDNANGCPGSITLTEMIHAWPVPEARFSASPAAVTIQDPLVQFIDESTNADAWLWNFGTVQDSSSTMRSPAFAFDSVACYTVTLDVTSTHGCTDNTELELCVEDGYALWVPNAFTPNGDDINDVFMVQSSVRTPKVFQLAIYNRWGEAIFNGGSLTDVWDGANAPNGVYVWTIKIIDTEGYPHERTGHVTLVR
ncbi:MAG: gliding motility-associated C-terminal domain-containing protein, partial [Flavobacteriales bacterium]